MAILIPDGKGALVTPPDILTAEPSGAWYSVPKLEATGDSETWKQVWPKRLYLYNEGDECIDITGGWVNTSSSNKSYATKKSNSLSVYSNANDGTYYGALSTYNKIPIVKYKKLCACFDVNYGQVQLSSFAGSAGKENAWIYYGGTSGEYGYRGTWYGLHPSIYQNGMYYGEVSLEGLNDDSAVVFTIMGNAKQWSNCYKIWLEP